MFDGLYSFVGVILSFASLMVCKIIKEKDNKDFYFGKYIFEPIVISLNSLALIIMCSISLINSIVTLLNGGSSIDVGFALVYSVISTVGCGLIYLFIKSQSKKVNSELIKTESVQWFMDFVLSGSIFIAFVLVVVLSLLGFSDISKYVDPLMVLVSSLILIRTPIKRFISNFKEVIGAKTHENIQNAVENYILEIKNDYGFVHAISKVMKRGRSVKVEVSFVNDGDIKDISLEEMHDIKKKLQNKIDTGKYIKDLEVTFVMGKGICVEIT